MLRLLQFNNRVALSPCNRHVFQKALDHGLDSQHRRDESSAVIATYKWASTQATNLLLPAAQINAT